MKNDWQIEKLEEICEVFADGDWIEKKDQSTSGIRLIQTGNIGNGSFLDRGEKARYISESTFKRLRCTEVLPGDCLLSRLPDPVGRAGLIPGTGQKMITAVDCTIMRFKKDVLPKWFIYYSLSLDYQYEINKEVTGATRQRISRSNLGNVKIPVPPISEQKQIVRALDVVFEKTSKAKKNAEKNMQNANKLFESYLQSVFANPDDEWEEKMLEEIGETQTGTTPKTVDKENYGSHIPFITPADINIFGDGIIRYREEGLSEKGLENGRKVKKNSILMVCIGASIGKVGFVDRDVSCNQQINSLTVNRGFCPKFFYYALSTKYFFDKVIKNSAQATLPIINKGKWKKLIVSYPLSEKKQQFIVARLDSLSAETKKLEAIYQQKLADLEELNKSILHRAFNGGLTGACS